MTASIPPRRFLRILRRAALAAGAGLCLAGAAPAAGQIFHRPRCEAPDCRADLFRLDVERMILTEGPLAADRDARDLGELEQRIRQELAVTPEDWTLWLALSEVESGLGDPVPAMAAATRALELGADSSLALRARAAGRMRMAGGEYEGATEYLAALARMSRTSRPRFLADVMPLLTQLELDWWRSAELETLRGWARDYWAHRAAVAGVRLEDRLAEHMRRVAAAARLYEPSGTGSGAAGQADVLRSRELNLLPFDDRGLVYVRRGPPHQELRVPTRDLMADRPTLTWLYGGVDGSVDAFHFSRGGAAGSGFRLVTAPACDPTFVGSIGGTLSNVSDGWVATAAGASADATRAGVSCFGGDAWTLEANARLNAIEQRRETLRALAEESPRAPFHRALPAFFDHYMFRGDSGRTMVVTPVVVPVTVDSAQPVELLVTFADRGGGVVRRAAATSSTQAAVRQSLMSAGEGWGVAYARTQVEPADDAMFRVVVRDPTDPDRGGMWGGVVAVRSFNGYGIEVSDLVVSGSGPATWSRGSTRLFLLPGRNFQPGTNAVVFYEIYDLAPGSTYRTELTLQPQDDDLRERLWRALRGTSEVRIRFDSQVPETAEGTLQEVRSLRMPDDEGRYLLTVRITDARGQVAESTRQVVISGDAAVASGAPAATTAGNEEAE